MGSYESKLMRLVAVETGRAVRRRPGVFDADDLHQDLMLFALGDGRRLLEKWVDVEPLRVVLALRGEVNRLGRVAESEDLSSPNHERDVQAWYRPGSTMDKLVAFAKACPDPDRPAPPSGRRRRSDVESGSLAQMIWDVQDALEACPGGAVEDLADWLGGQYAGGSYEPRRTAMSNRVAIAVTQSL